MRATLLLTLVVGILVGVPASGPAEAPKPDAENRADRYAVPQGGVSDLRQFIERLIQYKPQEPADVVEHRTKFRPALQQAAEQILKLEKDRGSETYEAARFIVLGNRVHWLARAVPEEQRRIVADVKAYLEEKLKQGQAQGAAGLAGAVAKVIQQTGQWDWAAETYPVAFGHDVRDWWDHDQGMPATRGRVVWTGSNPASDKIGRTLRLYLGVWENPHPEKTVVTLDFVKTEDRKCAPICLAITAE